jgi:hypothetical protein
MLDERRESSWEEGGEGGFGDVDEDVLGFSQS